MAYLERLQGYWSLGPVGVLFNIIGVILRHYAYFSRFDTLTALLRAVTLLVIDKKVYDFSTNQYVVSEWI